MKWLLIGLVRVYQATLSPFLCGACRFEPSGSSYAPSCLGPGEDGELYYDGFTVATYREGDKEIVWDVNVNAG